MFEKESLNSYRTSWVPQFGLYRSERYERNSKKKLSSRSRTGFYSVLAAFSVTIILIFLILSSILSDTPLHRYIIIERENRTEDNKVSSTPPLNSIQYLNNSSLINELDSNGTSDLLESADNSQLRSLMMYKFSDNKQPERIKNHKPRFIPNFNRKQFDIDDEPRPFDYVLKGTPPSAFQIKNATSVSFPQIPKDYVGNVKNIQEILNQVNGADLTGSGQKVRFEGTYRHRKDNDLSELFGSTKKHYSGTYNLPIATQPQASEKHIVKDPFYSFKPKSPADINLLASHQFRFAPQVLHHAKPKAVLSTPIPGYWSRPLFVPYPIDTDPSSMYQKIIAANDKRQKQEQDRKTTDVKNQKPFQLMLDVYPMLEDDTSAPPTRTPIPIKIRNPYIPFPYAYKTGVPNGIPLHLENSYFQNMNFAQLQKQRLADAQNYYNQIFLKKLKSGNSPYMSYRSEALENTPSQITVHLNLYPKNKNKQRNVEIISRDDTDLSNSSLQDHSNRPYKFESIDPKNLEHSKIVNSLPLHNSTIEIINYKDKSMSKSDTKLKPSDVITLAEVFRKYYDSPIEKEKSSSEDTSTGIDILKSDSSMKSIQRQYKSNSECIALSQCNHTLNGDSKIVDYGDDQIDFTSSTTQSSVEIRDPHRPNEYFNNNNFELNPHQQNQLNSENIFQEVSTIIPIEPRFVGHLSSTSESEWIPTNIPINPRSFTDDIVDVTRDTKIDPKFDLLGIS